MRAAPRATFLTLAAGLAAACDVTPRERFARDVRPVLERRCLSPVCHGVAPGAEAAGEVLDRRFFFVDVDARGLIVDEEAAYANLKRRINTVEDAGFSSLLRKPLALAAGGLPHAGGHPFASTSHPELARVRDWIAAEDGGGEGEPASALAPLEAQFARDVLPVLRDRGCMLARCHGPLGFAGTTFAPPMDGSGGAFPVAAIRENYHAARRNLALGGDATRSRLLVKALPLDAGGVIHRGGNDTFFPRVGDRDPRDDPGARAMVAWAEAERAAATGHGAEVATGLVFVRGPIAPRSLDDLSIYRPGSDVWFYPSLAPGAEPVNLTAAAHPGGPADVRDPAVSHDGTRLLFAMRASEDDCHNLYEIGLDGGGLRQLTYDEGELPGRGKAANRWPVYGPGGEVFFASTRAGELAEDGRHLDVELVRLARGSAPVRLTYTPTPELTPAFLALGEFRGSLAFTTLRQRDGQSRGAVFRFPPDHDRAAHLQPEYHPHHGQTTPGEVTLSLREMPDGRDLAILLPRSGVWQGGALAVIERQLGPEVAAAAMDDLSVPGFRHAVSLVDPQVATAGVSQGGLYADPAPLPDGRVAVAWARGPIELSSVAPAADTGIYLVSLANGPAGESTLAARELVVDAPGLADDQPAVVHVRAEEDEAHAPAWDDAQAEGVLKHSGAPIIEAVNRGLAPAGDKPLRDDARTARLVAWVPFPPRAAPPVEVASVANQDPASTWWSNGVHGPAVVLAEVPLAPDGSLYARVPRGVPFRVQLVDEDGLAAGRQTALWIHVQGGETFPQGVQPGRYGILCAGCHGALDGDPSAALPPLEDPDAIAGASITLATHAGRNPRRPLAPAPVPAAGEGFQFWRDLAPVLERSCGVASCHEGAAPAGGLDLHPWPTAYYDTAYEALQAFGEGSTGGKRWVDERGASARGSFLIEKITGRELGAPRALDFRCPPEGADVPPLSAEEIRAFARWIDLGAVYRTYGVDDPW